MVKINRRKFVYKSLAGTLGMSIGGHFLNGIRPNEEKTSPYSSDEPHRDYMQMVKRYRKIDAHAHVYFTTSMEGMVDYCERLGIDRLMVSNYLKPNMKGTPEEFRANNDSVIELMKQYPRLLIGTIVLNPYYQKESLEEIDRCRDAGMIGLGELYNQTKISDPLYCPVIEKCIDYNWNIMMHSGLRGTTVHYRLNEPENVSTPEDFTAVAKRYPEGMFQYAHLAGGIDWEYACKALKDYPNVFVDLGGSNNAANIVDFALEELGEDRLVFSTDNSFYQGVGQMFSANLTESQREKIFFGNIYSRLKKGGYYVD